jgi:hypothetical protein
VVTSWRARAAVEAPSHLRSHSPETTLTLLAALLYRREREITDTLVELLISTVHRINARAEVRVTKELIKEFQRVTGKENLLFRLAEATVDAGDRLVRDAVFPVAPQPVLRDLVAEFKASGPTYQRTGESDVASVVYEPLPGRVDQAAGRAGVPEVHAMVDGAIRTGTASTEAILRRFMKANAAHLTYQAMIDLGRAQKTILPATCAAARCSGRPWPPTAATNRR